jgi:Lrp/AsnC family transcriptional regulator
MIMPPALDPADLKILSALQDDASRSTVELAEIAGVSQSVCWRRIQRLKDEGIILRQVTLLDRSRLGLETQIFAEVKLSAHGRANLADFSDAIRAFPEVMECYLLLGAVDFLLKIVTENIRAYEIFFFEKLSRLPGVQEVNSIVVFSEVKATTALPLGERGMSAATLNPSSLSLSKDAATAMRSSTGSE